MPETTVNAAAQIAALAKAVSDSPPHGSGHISYNEVLTKLTEIVTAHPPNTPPTGDCNLTAAIEALTAWLNSHMNSVTKSQLDDAKAEIIEAVNALSGSLAEREKLSEAISETGQASEALAESVKENQP